LADAVEDVLRTQSSARHSLLPEALRASSVARRLADIYQSVQIERHPVRHLARTNAGGNRDG